MSHKRETWQHQVMIFVTSSVFKATQTAGLKQAYGLLVLVWPEGMSTVGTCLSRYHSIFFSLCILLPELHLLHSPLNIGNHHQLLLADSFLVFHLLHHDCDSVAEAI